MTDRRRPAKIQAVDIAAQKAALRKAALERRRALSPEDVRGKSAAIARRVMELEAVRDVAALLSYVDSKDNEVITRGIISWALGEGKRVHVPVTDAAGGLRWPTLASLEHLVPGRFGILEPRRDIQRFEPVIVGMTCLVPGICFSRDGGRIGYGMGCFDRFLSESAVCAIGLAFEEQLHDALPAAAHDVRMEWVITEDTAYKCG